VPHSAFPISAERDKEAFNRLQLSIPYVNAGDQVTLHVISVDNTDDDCEVKLYGVGVDVQESGFRESRPLKLFYRGLRPMLPPIVFFCVVLAAVVAADPLMMQLFPASFSTRTVTVERVSYPPWYYVVLAALMVLGISWIVVAFKRSYVRMMRRYLSFR
jgi:hypothetical protein